MDTGTLILPGRSGYVGEGEGDKWWKAVESDEKSNQTEDDIYRILVNNTGVFRWQTPQYAIYVLFIMFANDCKVIRMNI